MSYKNYKPKVDVSGAVKPENTHLAIENSAKTYIYFVDSADNKIIKKVNTSTGAVTTVYTLPGGTIYGFWYDRDNSRLYYGWYYALASGSEISWLSYIDLTDDSNNSVGGWTVPETSFCDVFILGGNEWMFINFENTETNHVFVRMGEFGVGDDDKDMGDHTILGIYDMGFVIIVGTDIYFLWKWSTENVELWKYDASGGGGGGGFTEMKDCGANTDLPDSHNQRGISYDDSDLLYFVLKDTSDSKTYLYTYRISTETLTKKGQYNIVLMLDRNTAPGVLEKAFHISKNKIYQIDSNYEFLYNIANPNIEYGIAITDNYLISTGANIGLYEYIECSGAIKQGHILTQERRIPICELLVTGVEIDYSQYMKFEDIFTSSGATASGVLFEGYVDAFDGKTKNRVELRSIYGEDFAVSPTGVYSGTIDVIASGIVRDWTQRIKCNSNTLSAGNYVLTGQYSGDQNIPEILDDLTEIESFTWYLHNQSGTLWMGKYSVDSEITFSGLHKIKAMDKRQDKHKNKIQYFGGSSGGVDLHSTTGDVADQSIYGIMPKSEDNPIIQNQGVLDSGAKNLLDVYLNPPLRYRLFDGCRPTGMIQVGEKFTMDDHIKVRGEKGYAKTGIYYFNASDYNMKSKTSHLWVSSGLYYD